MNENKFDGMGKIYAQYRPSYPQDFIDYLYGQAGLSKESIIADIGSGTGILTKQLLEKGNRVFAVEPNDDMRRIADENLQGFSRFVSVTGSAENTKLNDDSIDFVTAAQAFHWFNRQNFKTECRRILKADGKVVLLWNSRDDKSELVIENDVINKKYCPNFAGFTGGMRGETNENDFNDFFRGDYEKKVFRNDLPFDEQSFIGRNLSASYSPKENEKTYSDYITALKELFKQYSKDGILIMPNFTRSYVGKV